MGSLATPLYLLTLVLRSPVNGSFLLPLNQQVSLVQYTATHLYVGRSGTRASPIGESSDGHSPLVTLYNL